MKVLYTGVYRDGTGWGNAAIDYILSLDAADVDVVPRAVKLNNSSIDLPDRILELESKDDSDCDVMIQHLLPHHTDYSGGYEKNIVLYASETDNFRHSAWASHINCMDEAWVINQQMVDCARNSGVTVPIQVIPHATNTDKFSQEYDNPLPQHLGEKFTFYFIGENNPRKNIRDLLVAFHSEFSASDNVSLLIKSTTPGLDSKETHDEIRNMSNKIKMDLKIFPDTTYYIEEAIVTDRFNQEQMMGIHQHADCFVMPSYGEAWCIPAFNAMGMGNTPIVNAVGGMIDYIDDSVGFLIPNRPEPVIGMTNTFMDIYTGSEDWWAVDINEMKKAMRFAYENNLKSKSEEGFNRAFDYSYHSIGLAMKEALNA